MKKIKLWWIRTFNVISTEQAIKMGLTWKRNVYGDEINLANCRSIWLDEKENSYRVAELKM